MARRPTAVQLASIVWTGSYIPLGDRALTVDLSDADDVPVRAVVRALATRLATDAPRGVTALVPAVQSLTIHYDPQLTSYGTLCDHVDATFATLDILRESEPEPIVIPVCYGGEFGPDLTDVAAAHHTSPDAIVAAHVDGLYTVAMIGFLPGFPYLDGLAPSLHTPRRAIPRTAVPAGSVGIGGSSTGVYPFTSPGGWHIIGRTTRALFAPQRQRPSLLQAGDRVRFVAITPAAMQSRMEQP